jgi:hypothetical protein
MTADVEVIGSADLQDKRCTPVLVEDRLGHYVEFSAFFARIFDLQRVGLSASGYIQVRGRVYQLVFIGRSGEPFPSGVEINAIVSALEPLDDATVDADLWAILRWVIAGVGPPWTVADLEQTGRLYRLPSMAREG